MTRSEANRVALLLAASLIDQANATGWEWPEWLSGADAAKIERALCAVADRLHDRGECVRTDGGILSLSDAFAAAGVEQ